MKKIFPLFITLMINQLHAHGDACDDEDFLVKEFGDLGKVELITSCEKSQQTNMNTALSLFHHMMY